MRSPFVNPLPFCPKSEVEKALLELAEADSGGTVLEMLTPEQYNERHETLDGSTSWPGDAAQYWIRTGSLRDGLFVGGSVYLGHVQAKSVKIEKFGGWV